MLKRNKKWIALGVVLLQMFAFFSPVAFASQPMDAGDIAVDSIRFPDQVFRSWILNPNNLNGFGSDGVLTTEERNNVTEIKLPDQNISDLTGIEYFTSLSVLDCRNNHLTSLDLSQNKLLKELYCSSNQLSRLDLSNNTNLERLYCASNRLIELNVTNCSKLISLNCERNRLTDLDLSGNPQLVNLYSRHNQLTQLDVSHNTKLVFIETFDNQLTSFDCTMLKDLEFLHIDYNKLTTLDMSQNPNLKGNGFVAANNQLEDLTMPNIPGVEIEAAVFYEQNPKQGYETVEWFYDAARLQQVQETDMIPANGQKIYAKWIPNPYTVYYHSNGGQGEIPPQSVEYDQTFTLVPNTFTRTGYTFQNWNTSSNAVGGRPFQDGQEVVNLAGKNPNNNRLTLYAQWKANTYTIRYDANGGEGSTEDTPAVYDQPVSLSEGQFTRADHVLAGWSLTAGDQNSKDYFLEQTVRNLTPVDQQVVTLYAVWISYGEIQQEYQDWLADFFSAYKEDDYYPEDWSSLENIRQTASEAVINAGADISAMQQAIQTAFSSAEQIKTKEQRAEEIVQSWEAAHDEILSKTVAVVPMDQLEEYRTKAELAVSHSEPEWLAQQSTLLDPFSRQTAVGDAQSRISSNVQQLCHMQGAMVWLDSVKDSYQTPMESVKSTDTELYSGQISEYNALSFEEKIYCEFAVLNQLELRKQFAEEKRHALQSLNIYFSSIELSDYTEENQKKLAEIMDEAQANIENADMVGMADRLLLESMDNLKQVEQIVRQKVPNIEVLPEASAITKGQKLDESRLTGGKAETEGVFSWKDGSIVPAQTGAYTVIFTPKDGKVYLPVELSVTVSVLDPAPNPELPTDPDIKPDPVPTPETPSSPDTVPDTVPPSGSAVVNGSAQTSDDLSQLGQTVRPDNVDTENKPNASEPSEQESAPESSDTASDSSVRPNEDSEDAPMQEQYQTNLFVVIVLVVAGAVVIAVVSILIVKKRK